MKTRSKLLLIAALGLGLARSAVFAQTDATNQPPVEPPPGPPPAHHLSQLLTNLLDKYDANKDGILDQTELATLKQDIESGKIAPPPGGPRGPGGAGMHRLPKEILDQYDVNKDGVLDANERAALHKDVEAGKVQLPTPGALGSRPPAPDAKQVLLKFDANKDGMLDETELAAFLKEMQAHRPPMHPGPGGPGGPPPADAPQQ
jgi:Ca2+-binding EF-hand superfamily protein